MKLCRNCRWYDRESCSSEKAFPPSEEESGVYIYFADSVTVGPNFGCVHWEKSHKEEIKKELAELGKKLGVDLDEIRKAIS